MGRPGPSRRHRLSRRARHAWRVWSRRHPWVARSLRLAGLALVVLGMTLGVLAVPLACTTQVIAPPVVGERAVVLLVDHGRTPSLVLPTPEGGHDRWAYGDWGWYARGRTSVLRGPVVLFWPTQGALGRERFGPSLDLDQVAARIKGEKRYRIVVAAEDARRLQGELTALFNRRRDTLVQQVGGPLLFVHHPRPYTYFGNSNHMAARWLRELGCETRGPAFYSRWSVRPVRVPYSASAP